MTRILALLSSTALLGATALAQCPQGATAGLVKWSSGSGYASTFVESDEGITNPPIALTAFANFPMAGAVGNLDQIWVNSNGELYLTDSTLALTQPVGGASFGVNTIAEMRGSVAGGSARIVPLGGDHQASVVAGSSWSVTVDQSGGVVTATWVDMRRFGNATDKFSFRCILFPTGAVQYDYGTTFPLTGFTGRYVGISIGNLVGTTTSPNQDLSVAATSSGTVGMIYQNFTGTAPNVFDLAGQSLTIIPNGTGGYDTLPLVAYVPPICASNVAYGTGCHTFVGPITSTFLELFPDSPTAKAALDGNAVLFTLAGSGYGATWIPAGGALYVAPSGGETPTGLGDDGVLTITPSAAAPVPGGSAAQWTISSNGILTAGAVGNQGTSFSPSLAATNTAAGLAFYCWRDWNPAEAGSGPVVYEEIGGILYVTWNDVEAYGTPSPNRGTWQFQVNLTTGDVTLVMVTFEGSTSTADVLVGVNLAGTSAATPASQTLSASGAATPDVALSPMTLSASGRPVINPSSVTTYTANNLPEFQPSSGIYLSTLFLSVNPLPGGFDVQFILTTVAGCNAYIATLDADLGAQLTFAPTASWNFTYDNVNFAPGNAIAAQAVALFDGAFPLANGEAGGFLLSNGVLSTTELQ